MSIGARVTTEVDTATPWLAGLPSRITTHEMAAQLGPGCARLMQGHFRAQGANKRGWPSTEFWSRAADATNWIEGGGEGGGFVDIDCNQIGIRQQIYGGDIRPVNAKALTIPAAPEAYGKTAGEFNDLKFGFEFDPQTGTMRPCLKSSESTLAVKVKWKRSKTGATREAKQSKQTVGAQVMFWLCGGVTQKPHPDVVPSDEDFGAAMDTAMGAILRRLD